MILVAFGCEMRTRMKMCSHKYTHTIHSVCNFEDYFFHLTLESMDFSRVTNFCFLCK